MSSTREIRAVFRDLNLNDSDAHENLEQLSALDKLHDVPEKPELGVYSRSDTTRE